VHSVAMKTKVQSFSLGALAAAAWLLIGANALQAQNGPPQGNFDPAQMRQRMMERMREQFEATDDAEWKLISERINKVMDLRRAGGGMGGMGPGAFRGGPGGPPPGAGNGAGPRQGQGGAREQVAFRGGPGGPGGPGGFNRPSTPEMETLRKAVDAKASAAELKTLIADVKAARAKRQAELETAQEELRQILNARQEAVALSLGLL